MPWPRSRGTRASAPADAGLSAACDDQQTAVLYDDAAPGKSRPLETEEDERGCQREYKGNKESHRAVRIRGVCRVLEEQWDFF